MHNKKSKSLNNKEIIYEEIFEKFAQGNSCSHIANWERNIATISSFH